MEDNSKKKGRDRELVSEQEHEVAYLMRAAKVTRQKAVQAIREAGPTAPGEGLPCEEIAVDASRINHRCTTFAHCETIVTSRVA
ncbi:hypothetical protein CEJ86_19790 [Sinorhizobium meliloti]|uniref:Uncharacterized protein n=1 Tax=Rhizobium meliloti TaxID=382 RepID=A0A2J0Z0I4_RHIML|nr:hypothetical protein CEJ86_19790 [Sinorhizobium meliloti]